MKIIDWYIARKFLGAVVFMLVITAVITVVFDVSEKLKDFNEAHLTLGKVVMDYYIHFIPTIVNLISPLVIFLSAMYFTSRLANQSEILALLASGMSYGRLLRPYIIVAIFLALTDMGLKNFIFPRAYSRVFDFENKYIIKGYRYDQRNIHRKLPGDGGYFYAENIDFSERRAYHFAYEKFDSAKRLIYKLRADEAFYDTLRKEWKVGVYQLRTYNGDEEKLEQGDSIRLQIPISINEFGQKVKAVPAMTTPELEDAIKVEKLTGAGVVSYYEVEKWKRISAPVDTIIMVIIAVGLASRKVRGGLGAHLLLGVVIAVSHEMIIRFATTFSTNSDLPASVAVWIPTVLYSGLMLLVLARAQR